MAHGHGRNLTTTWLISVEEGRQIWLAWTRFHLEDWYEDVSVWDGAGESSPLLLQHSGSFQVRRVPSVERVYTSVCVSRQFFQDMVEHGLLRRKETALLGLEPKMWRV